jgi:hypothetical protein
MVCSCRQLPINPKSFTVPGFFAHALTPCLFISIGLLLLLSVMLLFHLNS